MKHKIIINNELFILFKIIVTAKNRSIAIPSDLENQVATMFTKSSLLSRQTSKWLQASKTPKIERSQSQVNN